MKLIVLYGPPASGKYTIASAIVNKTGYKLFHNHLTVDILKSVLPFGTNDFFKLNDKIRLDIIEEAARQNVSGIIFTYVYEKGTDDNFIHSLVDRVSKHGGEIKFIQIYCQKEELLKRVKEESRKQFQKINTEESLLEFLSEGDLISSISFVDSIKIDSTLLSVSETIQKVNEAID